MFNMPIVRIEIDGIRQQIAAALVDHGNQIGMAVDNEILKAIDEYPFEQKVRESVRLALNGAIDAAVNNYFKHGDGELEVRRMIDGILSGVKDNQ